MLILIPCACLGYQIGRPVRALNTNGASNVTTLHLWQSGNCFGNAASSSVNWNWRYYWVLNLIEWSITLKFIWFIQLSRGCFSSSTACFLFFFLS